MFKTHHYILTDFDDDGENESAAKVALFNRLVETGIDPEHIRFGRSDRAIFCNGRIKLDPEGGYLLVSASVR